MIDDDDISPSKHFTTFLDKNQVYQWRDMIIEVARHYVARYSLEEVRLWLFESWNEPDCGWFKFDGWENYYDACSEGLKVSHAICLSG